LTARLEVGEGLSAIGPALAWARRELERTGAPLAVCDDAEVCLEEALANLALHAVPRGAGKGVSVAVEGAPGAAALCVRDACVPFDPLAPRASPADSASRAGGRGLLVMKAVAHALAYREGPDENELRLTFHWPDAAAVTDALDAIPAFARLGADQRIALASAAHTSLYPAGAMLIAEGAESDAALVLVRGSADVLVGAGKTTAPVAHLEAPALVGEIGALAGLLRTASVRARSHVTVTHLPKDALVEAGRLQPDLLLDVVGRLGGQIRAVNLALATYSTALDALERGELDDEVRAVLREPGPELAAFGAAFEKLAARIKQERRVRADMASAAAIPRAMLQASGRAPARDDGADTFADLRPARAVSGDLFDFIAGRDGAIIAAIGDVCGKGVPASLFMASSMMALRMAAQSCADMGELAVAADDMLCARNDMAMFTTAIIAEWNPRSGKVSYVSCGHNPPAHVRADGAVDWAPSKGAPMGMFAGWRWRMQDLVLAPGEALFLYTDGVTEALDPDQAEYGEERLAARLAATAGLDAEAIVREILADVETFARGAEPSDDITCLCLKAPR
jgi:serine phosphatase RsbU (regulator of sigma subunit)/anti-sigma regulatory factor (Ser/Thr protein kinase)